MTQHIDKVALAIWRTRYPISAASGGKWSLAESKQCLAAARAAMRAVVTQMREPSREMCLAGLRYDYNADLTGTENASSMFRAMLDAYAKEAGIDE